MLRLRRSWTRRRPSRRTPAISLSTPNLNAHVLPLLPAALAAETRRLTTAERDLLRLSRGAGHRKLKVGAPPPLSDLVSFYREAQARYGVGWNYLAAIHLVETKFGRVKSNSVAGAQGPMQFIPSTWQIYGNGGDIQDPHDAILAAANLLHNNGAPPQIRPGPARLQRLRPLRGRGHALRARDRREPVRALLPLLLAAVAPSR